MYEIEKHRYYELKHYCLQYMKWKQLYSQLNECSECSGSDPTATKAITKADLDRNVELVDKVAAIAGNDILKAFVTEGKRIGEIDWTSVRYFFWLLDQEKGI